MRSPTKVQRRLSPPPPNTNDSEFGARTSAALREMRERAGWSDEGEQQRIEEGWTRRAFEAIEMFTAEELR